MKEAPLLEREVKPGMRNCFLWQVIDTTPVKGRLIKKKARNASLRTAGFSHQSLACLSKLICPSCMMCAGKPSCPTAKACTALWRSTCPSHLSRVYSIWLSCQFLFHPSLTPQTAMHLRWPSSHTQSHALLSQVPEVTGIHALHCLSTPATVNPWRRYMLVAVWGPTNTNAAHLTNLSF